VPILKNLLSEVTTSGLTTYMAIIISDSKDLALFWKEISMALIESLPLLTITYLLLNTVVFLTAFKITSKNLIIKRKLFTL
jgi:hypothetical protein